MVLKDRKLLARLMAVEGLSQRDLATTVGWASHSYVGRLLRGQARAVNAEPAAAIAAALGVPVDTLFASAATPARSPVPVRR